jgi:outer membrane protein assembly factor BamE
MQKLITLLVFAVLALSMAGCHLVYTPDVQQGNLLDKEVVGQLKPGMTKRQVLVLMGTPSVSTPFDTSRWDYVSTQQHRGGPIKLRTFTLTFNNDTLVRTQGDFFAQDAQQLVNDSKKYHASYPVNETKGDKNTSADDKKDDGGFGSGSGSGSGTDSGNATQPSPTSGGSDGH